MTPNPRPCYVPACPPWCEHRHPAILAPDADPGADLDPASLALALMAAPSVDHVRRLTNTADGVTVDLVATETYPDRCGPGLLFAYLPDHDDNGATAAQLRGWAADLATAADLADTLTA